MIIYIRNNNQDDNIYYDDLIWSKYGDTWEKKNHDFIFLF